MGGVGKDFILHPLMHTLLDFTLAQDVEMKKSGAAIAPLMLFEKMNISMQKTKETVCTVPLQRVIISLQLRSSKIIVVRFIDSEALDKLARFTI